MRDYEFLIEDIYTIIPSYISASERRGDILKDVHSMEIPIKENVFEIPTFVLAELRHTFDTFSVSFNIDESIEAIITEVGKSPITSSYKSVERAMKDNITSHSSMGALIKTEAKKGHERVVYYVTHGLVMNDKMKPVMMCSWIINRQIAEDGTLKFKWVQPVLRVDPKVFIYKEDEMEKFIVNRMVKQCLEHKVAAPLSGYLPSCFEEERHFMPIRVEIFPNCFNTVPVKTPSISTTNDELKQAVLDNLEDIQHEY